mmetsp:Transcript_2676/g.5964  ORF Transcript_2676/g.5964 Transcript_2676/m.5964 type:complete len:317 (+) Transcript_2676:276-1226(+)
MDRRAREAQAEADGVVRGGQPHLHGPARLLPLGPQESDGGLGHALGVLVFGPLPRAALGEPLLLGRLLRGVGGLHDGHGPRGDAVRRLLGGLLPTPRRRVPPVLHRVLGAAGQELGNFGPAVAPLGLRLDQDGVLVLGPPALLQARVQVVKPALATLFSDAAGDPLGDLAPLGDPGLDAVDDDLVLFFGPRSFDQPRLQHFLPPVEALHVAPRSGQVVGRDELPRAGAHGLHRRPELRVLLLGPPSSAALGVGAHGPLRARPPLRRGRHGGGCASAQLSRSAQPAHEHLAIRHRLPLPEFMVLGRRREPRLGMGLG